MGVGLDLHACGRTNVRSQPPAVPGFGAADGLEPAFSDTQPPAVPGSVVVPAAPVILTCCLQYLVPELQAVVVVLQRLARHTSCDPLALQPFNPSTTVELKSQLWFLIV